VPTQPRERRLSDEVTKRSRLIRALWILGAAVILLFVARTFIGDVYHVDSGSM